MFKAFPHSCQNQLHFNPTWGWRRSTDPIAKQWMEVSEHAGNTPINMDQTIGIWGWVSDNGNGVRLRPYLLPSTFTLVACLNLKGWFDKLLAVSCKYLLLIWENCISEYNP